VQGAVSRREFLQLTGSAAAGLALPAWARVAAAQTIASPWDAARTILSRIVPPRFPSQSFDITRFGAKPDGLTDATPAIRAAVVACQRAGGGRVVVPAGAFPTGPVRLESGVALELDAAATLLFSRDPKAYLPPVFTRFEGVEYMNYSPFIYAFEAEGIGVLGRGTLDGQANEEHWWPWQRAQSADRNRLLDLAVKGAPVADRVFGDGHVMRPNFVQFYRCRNVLLEGVTIVNSPMWEIHPCLCTNVTVRGVNVRSHGPNNDGCDPESCQDVLIEDCTFDTGDDCIAIKSGRNDDGRRLHTPVENVIVRNCQMKDGHGGVTVGSEITGGARNIFVEGCRMDSPQLQRALRFKDNAARGGVIEHVYMRDVTVGEVSDSVVSADFYYEEGEAGAFTPILRDVEVRNVSGRKSKFVLYLRGYERAPITDIRLVDCTFDGVTSADVVEHVERLQLTNVRVNGAIRGDRSERAHASLALL
jgi:polygalacturonase